MVRRSEFAGVLLGGIGIFFLDMGFNGSAASDLFFPPQLRTSLPPVLKNISLPAPPGPPAAPVALGGYLPAGQNLYLYLIGGIFLAIGMLILVLANRRFRHESFLGRELR